MVDRRPSGGSENQLESLRGSCKKALFFRFGFLMGPALFIVLGSVCLVLQSARSCTPQRGGGCGGAGVAGRCEHRPLQGFVIARRLRFPPVGRGPAVGRRGGIYPSRGCLRRRGVRRDEGIPPYGRFIGFAYTGNAACFRCEERHVGADSISARDVCGGAGRADMESAPTGGCSTAGFALSRLAAGPPLVVGEGFIPPAGVCGGAGCGGIRASRPTVVL